MDTWKFYATVVLIRDDTIDGYIEDVESMGFELDRDEDIIKDGQTFARMTFVTDTDIRVTGRETDGGEPDEIVFEPDDIDEDPNEWADPLITMGAELEDAWFDFDDYDLDDDYYRRGRLKPLPNPLKGIPLNASTG